jgi:hypothetical protein
MRRVGTDDQTECGLLFDDATFRNAGASALFIAGAQWQDNKKKINRSAPAVVRHFLTDPVGDS